MKMVLVIMMWMFMFMLTVTFMVMYHACRNHYRLFFEAIIANYIAVSVASFFLEGPQRIRLQVQLQAYSLEGSIRIRSQLICFTLHIRQH